VVAEGSKHQKLSGKYLSQICLAKNAKEIPALFRHLMGQMKQ
jgi:hypothetical protein